MASFENTQGISQITFKHRTNHFCPLGLAHYTNQFSVSLIPGKTIPDYIDIQRAISEKVNHKDLTIEDAVAMVFDIVNAYEPKALTVKSYVDDAAHFPVEVMKSQSNEQR